MIEPIVKETLEEADANGDSLSLIRPKDIDILWEEKTDTELKLERRKHAALAAQASMFDAAAKPLNPCPIKFEAKWRSFDGKVHNHAFDDWETSAAYNRFERMYGRTKALEVIKRKYEQEYFKAGLVLAFSTHRRRNVTNGMRNQWLLVGLIRLNMPLQGEMAI